MGGESHEGVVAFKPLALGREAVMLGHVQVGEIMPTDGGRHQACYRLTLPEASTSAAWRPARDLDDARRLALVKVNDWLNAADLRPNGANMSKTNLDLPKHAADKVERALQDVLQLTDDPGEMLRIYLLAAGVCIGGAGGTLAGMMERDGLNVPEHAAKLHIMDLLRKVVTEGAEVAWKSLAERNH